MGLISQILHKNYSQADFDRDIRQFRGGTVTKSGIRVNEQGALRHITVLSCVRVRSESFASLPVSVYKKRRDGKGRDEARDHPIHAIVHSSPNSDMVPMTLMETMNGHLDLSGNCYSLITLNKRGNVIDLYPWDWDKIEPVRNLDTNRIEYKIYDRGKFEMLPSEKVFHVPGLGNDGIKGYSIISLAREHIGLGMAVNEFVELFYGQGMNIGTVLQTTQNLKKEAVDELLEQYNEQFTGLRNSHKAMLLHSGLTYNRIPMPLTDAQTIELLKLTDNQICGLYRVPPHMVAHLERSTNNNIEHQGIEYVIYSMLPLITRWEQTMNWKLFTPAEREAGYYVKFNVDALLRGDSKARGEYLKTKRQNGIINGNEWRALDDDNPIAGPEGEAYLVNGNMISVKTASMQLPRQTKGGGDNQNEDDTEEKED